MAEKISIDTLLETAIQIEKDGSFFYNELAGMTDDEVIRKKLDELVQMEEEHLETFRKLKSDYAGKISQSSAFSEELELYIDNSYDKIISFNLRKETRRFKNDSSLNIQKVAIDFERETLLFYFGLSKLFPYDDEKKIFDQIMNEEMGHIAKISNTPLY